MRKLFFLVFCWPFLTQAQVNQDSIIIKKMSDEIMTNGKAYELLRQLTKQIGGRLAGSPQQQNAAIWGKRNMESFAADKVYMQPCKTPNWQRGGKDFVSVVRVNGKAMNRPLAALALGNSLGSNGLVEAELLAVADFDELEKRKAEVKGKIVYYHSMFDPTIVQTFGAYGKAGIYRATGASRAAKYGAVGVMLHSLSTASDNAPHTGGMKYDEDYPKIPAVALGPNDAKELYANAKKGTIRVQMQTYGYFLPDADENNVVAEIKGSTFPNEIITIGGHLDSWDVNEGAHDDGAGIVQTMEILRTMKALNYQPKRTIRFVLFANEENGLRGGNKYAELAKQNNEQHVFALESDAGGFTPRAIGISATSPEQFKKMEQWASLLKPYGTEIRAGGGGADIGPLKNVNPSIVLAGLVPDSQRYFDLHHAKTDVFENVNKRELLLGAVNMAAIIYLVDQYGVPK
ncbi:MAG: M20/M25/M40 family metallo-hydrolase [Chitinophagaceae bacterium]|nr:M20/M25/M40 family metallo-hydrolase [Chitinophagaceae bacterium]